MIALKSVTNHINKMQVNTTLEWLNNNGQVKDAKVNDITLLIHSSALEQLVQKEFSDLGIGLEHHIGVYDVDARNFIYSTNSEFNNKIINSPHFVVVSCLFDENKYHLSVYFPQKHETILRGVLKWLIFLFALLAVLVWSVYSIFTMFLYQKKLSDMKGDFVNNVTHEFKTPIASVALAAEMLSSPEISSNACQVQRYAKIIGEENNRLRKRVDQVLYLSSFKEKDMQLSMKAVDIHNVLKNSFKNYRFLLRKRKGAVTRHFGAPQAIINGDAAQLEIVFGNLIDNAIKYSLGPPEITIGTKPCEGGLIVSVTDKGVGINREHQQEIFRRFYRVRTGDRHDVKGFGLGLYYVKAVVEAHNGSISVKSSPGKGSCFEIFFPNPEI